MPRRRLTETRQIQAPWWDAHETVLIRSLKADDIDWINDSMAEMQTSAIGAKTEVANMQMKIGTIRRLTLVRGIVNWSFTDDAHNSILFSEAALRDLAPEDADFIYQEINKLNQPMSEAEKKASQNGVNAGLQADQVMSLSQ